MAPASAPPPTTLPVVLSTFVGRERELEELSSAVGRARLLTITGSGGVGKTRLALAVAERLLPNHPGGVWWVDLAPATTEEAVLAAVADACQIVLGAGERPRDELARRLRPAGPALLVLDGAEHVLSAVAPLVALVAERCPELRVLATSREPLGMTGEVVWRAASLALPPASCPPQELHEFDAAALFLERAREARPNLVVDGDAARVVVTICERLDGVPLALELAAARTRAMSLSRLSDRLVDAFTTLTGGSRTLLSRHQTVLASITWSHDLLSDDERIVFRRLSVCRSPFDLDAAEAVAADGGVVDRFAVLDVLTRLVDKSMVEFDPVTDTYRLLDTVRQFALDRLVEAGELESTRDRHAHHWAATAIALGAWGPDMDLERLRPGLNDVLVALDWAMQHDAELADQVVAAIGATALGQGRWGAASHAIDWVVRDRARGPSWPAAVASVTIVAPFLGRSDVVRLGPDARDMALAAGDLPTADLLLAGPAFTAASRGHYEPARVMLRAAHDTEMTQLVAGTTLIPMLVALGSFGEAQAVWTAMLAGAVTGRHPERLSPAPSMCRLEAESGRLAAAVAQVPAGPPPSTWSLITGLWAAAVASLAVDTADPVMLEAARALVIDDGSDHQRDLTAVLAWAEAVLAGHLAEALMAIRRTVSSVLPFVALDALTKLVDTAVAVGDQSAAAEAIAALHSALARIHEPAPLPEAVMALAEARLAAGRGDGRQAVEEGFVALERATSHRFRLLQADALEAVAAGSHQLGDQVRAARLLGAARRARSDLGYRSALRTTASLDVLEHLAAEHPAAWAEGSGLDLDAAVELAMRTRGPRGRPSFGMASLSPTEQLVVERVASGQTNAEIAEELVISVATVKTHLHRVFTKLGVRNRAGLVAMWSTRDGASPSGARRASRP